MSGQAGVSQVPLEPLQVLLHQRLQRRVDGGRGRPAVLAHDRVELVRQRERDAWPVRGEQLGDSELVRRIHDRPDQADRDRLDVEHAAALDRLEHAPVVEWHEDVALRVDALADLEGQMARHVGCPELELAEGLELPSLAEQQDVGKALGGEKGGARRLPLDDGVGRARRPVREDVGSGEKLGDGQPELRGEAGQGLLDALERSPEVGRRLGQVQHAVRVRDDDVREGPAGVDRDAKTHRRKVNHIEIAGAR